MADTVLVVEPDTAARNAMVDLLSTAGYETTAADAFEPAVQVLKGTRPKVLITVVRLGLFNGLDLVIRARARNPRTAALVVDDARDPFLERESRKVGATAYLVKPVDFGELLERVAEALASASESERDESTGPAAPPSERRTG